MHLLADMLSRYERSYFADRDFLEHPELAGHEDPERSRLEYIAKPLDAILANVEQSRDDVRFTTRRLVDAKSDGILDRERYKAAHKKEQARWLKCLSIVRGDYHRAVAELNHWREYARLATDGELPMPKPFDPRGLARSKSLEPEDRSVEDADVPF